jgi:hypothetical protein
MSEPASVPPPLETGIHTIEHMIDAVDADPEGFADYLSLIADIYAE